MENMSTNTVKVGDILVGGGFPVSVQTMWKTPLTPEKKSFLSEIKNLKGLGCDIIRFSVPDTDSAVYLGAIAKESPIPIVADIHFDYRIALECIKLGIQKIRINPGNIGALWKVEEVIKAASDNDVPLRVGVNGGSLPTALRDMEDRAAAMILAAEMEMEPLERLGFKNVVFSLKSSDIKATVEANTVFSEKYDYPLHLGVTEAGPMIPGVVKSTIVLQNLLKRGIGDTIRVSLSDTPASEVITGIEILKASGIKKDGVSIVSCPRCGRASFDTHSFTKKIESVLYRKKKSLSVAVMGCIVNGPGEARHADLGITGSGDTVVIFKKGKIIHKTTTDMAEKIFVEELEKL